MLFIYFDYQVVISVNFSSKIIFKKAKMVAILKIWHLGPDTVQVQPTSVTEICILLKSFVFAERLLIYLTNLN